MQPDPGFWHIDAGNIVTIVSFLFTLWRFHESNRAKITEISIKVDLMWRKFARRLGMSEKLEETDDQ